MKKYLLGGVTALTLFGSIGAYASAYIDASSIGGLRWINATGNSLAFLLQSNGIIYGDTAKLNIRTWQYPNACSGNGSDDSAFNYALNRLSNRGQMNGTLEIDASEKCTLTTNITIPTGVMLQGENRTPGYPTLGTNANPPYASLGSKITLSSTSELTLSSMTGLTGLIIQRQGITYLESNSSTFANTAITTLVHANDIVIERNGIFGFNLALDFTNGPARVHVRSNNFDNNYGIQLYGSGDSNDIENNHFWPFVTCSSACSNAAGSVLARTGTAITLENGDPDTYINKNLTYSYSIAGIYLQSVGSIFIDHLYCDGTGASCVDAESGTGSTYITESVALNKINGYNINPIAGDIHLSHNFAAFSTGSAYNFSSGTIYSDHDDSFTGAGGMLGNASLTSIGMNLGSALTGTIDHPSFRGIQAGYPDIQSGASGTGLVTVTNKITDKSINDPSFTGWASKPNTITCAEPLPIPQYGKVFTVSGTCTVTTIKNATVDRDLTLIFTGTPTLTNGTYMSLSGGTNWTPGSANAAINFRANGTAWVEVGRKN